MWLCSSLQGLRTTGHAHNRTRPHAEPISADAPGVPLGTLSGCSHCPSVGYPRPAGDPSPRVTCECLVSGPPLALRQLEQGQVRAPATSLSSPFWSVGIPPNPALHPPGWGSGMDHVTSDCLITIQRNNHPPWAQPGGSNIGSGGCGAGKLLRRRCCKDNGLSLPGRRRSLQPRCS